MDIVNVYNLVIRNNASWPGTDDILRDFQLRAATASYRGSQRDGHVRERFRNDGQYFRLTEGYNSF